MTKRYRMLRPDQEDITMEASDLVPAAAFTTDDTTETNHTFYERDGGKIIAGIWTCAPTREVIDAYPVDEMMTVISGSVTITNADGEAEVFGAGDSFFIEKGAKLTWEITETLTKHYFIAE